jgi:hypothetical protein
VFYGNTGINLCYMGTDYLVEDFHTGKNDHG